MLLDSKKQAHLGFPVQSASVCLACNLLLVCRIDVSYAGAKESAWPAGVPNQGELHTASQGKSMKETSGNLHTRASRGVCSHNMFDASPLAHDFVRAITTCMHDREELLSRSHALHQCYISYIGIP